MYKKLTFDEDEFDYLSQENVINLYCKYLLDKNYERHIKKVENYSGFNVNNYLKPSHLTFNGIKEMIFNINLNFFQQTKIIDSPIFSPFSVLYTMIIIYLGSNGNTKKQLLRALNIEISDYNLILNLGLFKTIFNKINSSVILLNNTSLLVKSGFPICKNFKDILINVSKGKMLFFDDKYDAVIKTNQWAFENTNGLIKNILNDSDVDNQTRIILINAIYFKANWEFPFSHSDTYKENFSGLSKNKLLAFMHMTNNVEYFDKGDSKYIKLFYDDKDYAFIIALPNSNHPTEIVKTLTQTINNTQSIFNLPYKKIRVKISLPKFEHKKSYDLVDYFKKMGVIDLFDKNSDLSLISKNKKLYVNKIIHESIVKINEKGTEAAAVTVVTQGAMLVLPPLNIIEFNANKTFYYAIVNLSSKIIFFNGIFNG